MSHLGRDFSSYQGNLTDADCEGIEFAFIKATQSGGDTGYQNPYAIQQAAKLRQHGVNVGFYHFYDPKVSVLDQLHDFQRYVGALGGTKLPLAIDSETLAPGGWPTLANDMVDFCMNVESWSVPIPNPKSIIYTSVSFARSLPGWPWGRWVWLADPSNAGPTLPRLILQTAPRAVSGTDPKVVDPDVFVGSEAQWATFIGGSPATPQPVNNGGNCDALVPGFNLAPGIPEVCVVGHLLGGGRYTGRQVAGGKTVYAGVGNPTTWVANQNLKLLPAGTPLGVAAADAGSVGTTVTTTQL